MKGALLLVALLVTAACDSRNNPIGNDNFVPIERQDEIYVLNTRTGEIFRVKDGQRFSVNQHDPELEDLLAQYADSRNPVNFDLRFGNEEAARVIGMSKLVGNQPKVRGFIQPYSDNMNSLEGNWFSLSFNDSDGFKIGEVGISKLDLVRTRIEGRIAGWSLQKDLLVTAEQYRDVESVDVTWSTSMDDAISIWLETEEGRDWVSQNAATKEEVGSDAERPSTDE